MSDEDCRSPIGLDCCSCCVDLANGYLPESPGRGGGLGGLGSPTFTNHFRQLRDQLLFQNLNTDKLNNIIMRQDSLESVVNDPCYLLNEGICNSNIDQTLLSILLFFHSSETRRSGLRPMRGDSGDGDTGTRADIASGASVVAIDNKIEQAMDLVKNHLMYAVREEVEILKEQIKELAEKNNQLERENSLLKNLASPEQMEKFQSRLPSDALDIQDGNNPEPMGQYRTGSAV